MLSDKTLLHVLRDKQRVTLWGDLVRGLAVALVILIGIALIRYYMYLGYNMFTLWHMNDFGKFYYSTRAFFDHGDMYAPNPATAIPVTETETRQFANMNPPHFHLLLLPIARLAPLPAILVWAAASAAALVTAIILIARELRLTWTIRRACFAVAAVVLCSATGTNIVTGQVTFVFMLPLTIAWISARRGQWDRAALLLGIVASVKPFLAVFWLYLLLTRRVRAAAIMAAAAAACVAIGLAVFGWTAYEAWLRAISGVNWAWALMNGSIEGMFTRSLGSSPFLIPVIDAPRLIRPLAAAASIAVGVTSTVILARDHSDQNVDRAFAILLLVALLISPLGWIYYVWFVAGPLLALWHTRRSRPSALRSTIVGVATIGLLTPIFVTLAWKTSRWGALTLGSIYFWTMLALWLAVIVDWRASRILKTS